MTKPDRELPPLEWIRVFETAARHLNFSAAAVELGLTQAAVSQRIRNLELRIGAQLFNRLPRGVTLSTQGEAWLPHVQLALQQLGRSTANLFAAPQRKVTIAASASVIGLWIVPRLTAIAKALPHLQIACMTIHNLTDYDRIKADFEIRFGAGQWLGRDARLLYDDALTPLASPDLAAAAALDWRAVPLIATSGPRLGWRDWCEATGQPPEPAPKIRFDTFIQSWQAALTGAGVILGSVPLCQPQIDSGQLQRLSPHLLKMNAGYWVTWRSEAAPLRERDNLLTLLGCAPASGQE